MRDDLHAKGFPIDPVSVEQIGQTSLYQLDAANRFSPLGASNPLYSMDFIRAVGLGLIPNYSLGRKFGASDTVGVTQQPVWETDTPFKFLESAELISYSSTSVNDAIAGTGAQIIQHIGIDSDGLFRTETVELVSGGEADTINTYLAPFRSRVIQAGVPAADAIIGIEDSKGAAGTISGRSKVTDKLQVCILPGKNITTQAIFRVPDNQEWTPLRVTGFVSVGKAVEFNLFVKPPTSSIFEINSEAWFFENSLTVPLNEPPIPSGSQGIFTVKSSASGTSVTALFEFLIHTLD